MIEPRLILCSGADIEADDPLRKGRHVVKLDSIGSHYNVNIQIEDVAKVFLRHLSPRIIDLIEIAAYVYTADAATHRGTQWTDEGSTESWSRDFHFVIPVRDPPFWVRKDVNDLLEETLTFLSNDKYCFQFKKLTHDRPVQEYLNFGKESEWPFYGVPRVLLFSGGLDSLAGAVEAATNGENLVLVTHRSISMVDSRQRKLFEQLRQSCNAEMIHVPVWINKAKPFWREHTLRTRSFLFAAIGAVVAASVCAEGVRFFENGIVSLNLPVADEVLRARASRTTHPISLRLFGKLFSLIVGRKFVVDNPYLFKTKADVVSIIAQRSQGHLIRHTCSCARTANKGRSQWHCGACSQCIDRRIAILAVGMEDNDPEVDYVGDVFIGSRKDGYEKNVAVNFARHVNELNQMSEEDIAERFNLELTRAVRYEGNRTEAARELIKLHKKYAETSSTVIQKQLEKHAGELLKGNLPKNSMLLMVAGQQHTIPSWHSYADRIADLLEVGIPKACKTNKPKNEPHLQEICDAILGGENEELIREFPFMRWSSSKTKPDWSAEFLNLWVEMKYIRKPSDIQPITEAIAADITKYGDNQRYTIFIVYDPGHLVTDEGKFSSEILRRPTMRVGFIR
jgi:7-cyano-7-deazaguanine synthase in queuosine biosynthesis